MTLDSNDEDLFPNSELSTTGLTGQPADLQDEDTASWYTADDPDSGNDVSAQWGLQDPSAPLSGTQNLYVYIRHTGLDTDPVNFTIDLYENGTQVETVISDSVASSTTSGAEFSGTWDASSISNGADVEFEFAATNTGGMPGTRDVAEIGYLTWGAGFAQELTVETRDPTSISNSNSTLQGELTAFAGFSSADVWFEWGQVGAGFPNSTTRQTVSSTGTFSETISLSEDTEYEFRAHAESGDASTTDQGSTISFWAKKSVEVTVDVDGTTDSGYVVIITRVDSSTPAASVVARETTDVNGVVSTNVEAQGQDLHVAAQYDDGSTKYAGDSKPYIS